MSVRTHPELQGGHVVLRLFDSSQIHDRYLHWLNDPVVNEHSQRSEGPAIDAATARCYLDGLRADEVVLGIYHREHDHIGNIKYGPIDWANRRADISILIGEPAVWGQGVGAESVYLVSKYLFEALGLNRVDAGTRNPAFVNLVKKLGWVVEGVLRQRIRAEHRYHDQIVLSQLAQDFVRRPQYEYEGVEIILP